MSLKAATSSSLAVPVNDLPPDSVIFGESLIMQVVREKIERLAGADVPVLIQGESGTGKEIVAKLVHACSPWKEGPFVKVHCPAIPTTLLESELFGYEKGAFTGAYGTKPGRVELAHRGTLFLDEISELDPILQAKLLQLLQDGRFCRIGAQEDMRVEVRVVCASNRKLEQEIVSGSFRQDLYYRINVLNVQLPALRERSEDIPRLVDFFLERYNQQYNSQAGPLSPQLLRRLQGYPWPGNIRELENLVKRYVILGSEEAISDELQPRGDEFRPDIPPKGPMFLKQVVREAVKDFEWRIILRTLQATHWNRKRTARILNISYRALLYKIKQAGFLPKRLSAAAQTAEVSSDD